MMKNFKIAAVAAVVAVSFSGVANAASDGLLKADGTGSEGTSDIILVKGDAVQITDVGDLDLGEFSTVTTDPTAADDVCVFSSTGGYELTVTALRPTFVLQSGGGDSMAYTVEWTANGTTSAVVPGVPLGTAATPLLGDNTDPTCGGTLNANFRVTVDDVVFNAANAGTYEDTLSLLVKPL